MKMTALYDGAGISYLRSCYDLITYLETHVDLTSDHSCLLPSTSYSQTLVPHMYYCVEKGCIYIYFIYSIPEYNYKVNTILEITFSTQTMPCPS